MPFLTSSPVKTALRGLAAAHPDVVALHHDPLYLTSRQYASGRRVGLVSGGGSGHEPLHAGFVGLGMLDAAVPGAVFASPHNTQIYAASRAVAGPGGVVHLVKNYTGDVINFAIAAERLAADGIDVARVLIDDDVATGSEDTATGRRGTGATVVVEKILGAAADEGFSASELAELGADVVASSRSVAVASRAHTDLHTGEDAFTLEPGQLEYGVGIHGERAARSIARPDFEELIGTMVDSLLGDLPGTEDLLVFVNGLGATTQLELLNVYAAVEEHLTAAGQRVSARLVGSYVAALDMSGFSLTLTRLRPGWIDYWNAPSATPAFPTTSAGFPSVLDTTQRVTAAEAVSSARQPHDASRAPGGPGDAVVRRFAALIEEHYEELTRLDQLAGDGDFGDNLRGGLHEALQLMEEHKTGLAAAESAFLDGVGGTSGPLLGLLFARINAAVTDDGGTADAWARGTAEGCDAIQRVGGAEPGDRTIVDVLVPTAQAPSNGFEAGAHAAAEAAAATASLQAKRGRASYVSGRGEGAPDAGAVGVSLLFRAAAEVG
ncbi:dihydroxyacetone kinase subunit DhaK [Zhihengliuella flava]|uniref:Dihydroxyacetone kinase n=1 Tax=Zhihengliuella flava TaxID=1285193 RepID=A0A931GF29_9MICC|nr:dihydroxyacetone kinase subunit DhaK [Zhihengliuella flava]MBG6084212.1 dihydroxyacetone kinase [Zhihengliuella flava]